MNISRTFLSFQHFTYFISTHEVGYMNAFFTIRIRSHLFAAYYYFSDLYTPLCVATEWNEMDKE